MRGVFAEETAGEATQDGEQMWVRGVSPNAVGFGATIPTLESCIGD